MLLAVEPKNDLVTSENRLERLYLIQYLMELKESVNTQTLDSISTQKLITINKFLESGKGHYEGNFINFPSLETAEIYSLISTSLTTEQFFNYSIKENIDYLLATLDKLDKLRSVDDNDKSLLVNFLSNLINNLNTPSIQKTRNFFDW